MPNLPNFGTIRAPAWPYTKSSPDLKERIAAETAKSPEVERPLNPDELADALKGAAVDPDKTGDDSGHHDREDGPEDAEDDSDDDDVGEHIKRLAGGISLPESSAGSGEGTESEGETETNSNGTENATTTAAETPKHKSLKVFVGEGSSAGWVDVVWLQVCPLVITALVLKPP
jgi:hypothetical protein